MGKSIKTSKYWGVSFLSSRTGAKCHIKQKEEYPWYCRVVVPGGCVKKSFTTEREAAIHADRINLEYKLGKPLNILKPKP